MDFLYEAGLMPWHTCGSVAMFTLVSAQVPFLNTPKPPHKLVMFSVLKDRISRVGSFGLLAQH